MKSFRLNFASIVSTQVKLNTPQTEDLQEAILSLKFILDYLFMSDVVSHLTNCSKTVQQSSNILWIYPKTIDWTIATLKSVKDNLKCKDHPKTIDWTIATLKSVKDNLKCKDLVTMSNNKGLFLIFFISPEIISSRQFKRCPL